MNLLNVQTTFWDINFDIASFGKDVYYFVRNASVEKLPGVMMRMPNTFLFFIFIAPIFLVSCDKGIEPVIVQQLGTMSGTIRYVNWPLPDSLKDLRIVSFTVYPPANIVDEVFAGRAIVYPALGDTALVPFFVDSLTYSFSLPASKYAYIVVAQQYGANVRTDWRPVGVYSLATPPFLPTPVTVVSGETVRDIDIRVDFVNRPPIPF